MSKYTDYNAVSRNYDNQRFALAVDVTCGMLQFYTKKPLQDLHVLDAGCGTGNYARDMIGYGASHMTLLDASEGMLEKARAKLSEFVDNGKVREIVHSTMPPIPFPDKSFDAVMFNLVLHHLEHEPDGENFPSILATLREARRVLKPDGVLSISTSLTGEIMHKIWFYHTVESISRRHIKQYPTIGQWERLFAEAGLETLSVMNVKSKFPPEVFKNVMMFYEGPAKKEWRDCNSYWNSATEEEIAEVERKIWTMKEDGTLEQFAKEHDTSEGYYDVAFMFVKLRQ